MQDSNDATAPALITYSSTIVQGVHGNCEICWEPLTDKTLVKGTEGSTTSSIKPSSRVDTLCRLKCPAVICIGCLQTHLTVAVESAFPGVLPKVRCPVCIMPMNKARWEHHATPYVLERYASLCRAAVTFHAPCCNNGSYSHLPMPPPINEKRNRYGYRRRSRQRMRIRPPAPQHLSPALDELCRRFSSHCATAKQLIALIEDTTKAGGDDARTSLYDHVMLRQVDEERRATLLLAYHHKYVITHTRCCGIQVCFNCKRQASFTDGIHSDWSTCAEEAIRGEDIAECPACHITVVKVEGCNNVKCLCGEVMDFSHSVHPFD